MVLLDYLQKGVQCTEMVLNMAHQHNATPEQIQEVQEHLDAKAYS